MKILESSQTLLHVLKRESVTLVKKKQSGASGSAPAATSQDFQHSQGFASAAAGGGGYVTATRTK
jgi:hypothetical protein